jgi:hypothetical protein
MARRNPQFFLSPFGLLHRFFTADIVDLVDELDMVSGSSAQPRSTVWWRD